MRAIIYIRVSTQEQARDGYSIGEQKDRLTKYCEAMNWTVVSTYSDPGYSGANMDRPGLMDLIRDVEAGKTDKIVVYKLDRLSRSQKDTLYLIEDVLLKNGVDLVSMSENFDTGSAFGRATIGILSVFAQLEREQIKERMQLGADARAKDGRYHGGPYAPIGYDYADGELVINPYEAMQVKKIWTYAEDGLPVYRISKLMDAAGYRHKYGAWTDNSIRSVLTTPVYAGRIVWKNETYPGRHEAIIEPDRFDAYDFKRRDTGKYKTVNVFNRTTLLGGLIFCGRCGARYYCKQNTKTRTGGPAQRYYTCYSRGKGSRRLVRDPNCKNKTYNVKTLDKMILDEIRKLSLDPDRISSSAAEPDDNAAIIKDRLREIDAQVERLISLYQLDGLPIETLNERIKTLNIEKRTLEEELAAPPELTPEETRVILSTAGDVLDRAEPEELRTIVETLIEAIIIDGDDITIKWRFS